MPISRDNQVNISEECRERVLTSDVIKIDIFEEARLEILKAIQVGPAHCTAVALASAMLLDSDRCCTKHAQVQI